MHLGYDFLKCVLHFCVRGNISGLAGTIIHMLLFIGFCKCWVKKLMFVCTIILLFKYLFKNSDFHGSLQHLKTTSFSNANVGVFI